MISLFSYGSEGGAAPSRCRKVSVRRRVAKPRGGVPEESKAAAPTGPGARPLFSGALARRRRERARAAAAFREKRCRVMEDQDTRMRY
jgi:type IV secretory pathway TrbL component